MPLTDNCDVFFSLSENAINRLLFHSTSQRPSMVNYGTRYFVSKPHRLCHKPVVAPRLPLSQPLITQQPYLSIPGTQYGLEYCAQITQIQIDFHPNNSIALPVQLGALNEQSLALSLEFCIGIGAQSTSELDIVGDWEAAQSRRAFDINKSSASDAKLRAVGFSDDSPLPIFPLPVNEDLIYCFCAKVCAVCHFDLVPDQLGKRLAMRIDGLEIDDISPNGLESIVEHIIKATLILGFLPRFRVSVESYVLSLGAFGSLSVGLQPTGPQIPNNPDLSNDQFSLFVDVS